MAIKIYFDNKLIPDNGIMALSQSGELFDSTFKLGATLCREVKLQVSIGYLTNEAPKVVKIYDDEDIKFTLYVDNREKVDDMSYSYTLVDSMVKLNTPLSNIFNWDASTSYTVQFIVDKICDYIGSKHIIVDYIGSLSMNWGWDTQARDFLSYAAEINASFVRITPNGDIEFVEHKTAPTRHLDVMTCEDFTVGEYHKINRVGYEQGTASIYYPSDQVDFNTVYINQDNVLITDSGGFTRENIIKHIYDKINGFEFYSITINRCQVEQSAMAGDNLIIKAIKNCKLTTPDGKFITDELGRKILVALEEEGLPTIVQINWNYNARWNGGYELEIDSLQQEETQIVNAMHYAKSINIKVDRELNIITQNVSNLESQIIEIASNDVDYVEIQYAQVQGDIEPQAWSSTITWYDEYKTYYRAKVVYVDTSIRYTDKVLLTKEAAKTVNSVQSLYYCGDSHSQPIKPTSAITDTSEDKYNAWTRKCPKWNSNYPSYYYCVQLEYTDGSYSWTPIHLAVNQSSIGALQSKIKAIESNISTIQQNESSISATVRKITDTELPDLSTRTSILETCVQLQADGLKISQGKEGAYTKITDDGMEIFSEGNLVAYTKKNGFYAIDYIMNGWHMVTANNKNSFCFVRKEYN